MAIMTHTKFHFNWLMLTLIFGIRASEPPLPRERLKRPSLIGLKSLISSSLTHCFLLRTLLRGGGGGEGG